MNNSPEISGQLAVLVNTPSVNGEIKYNHATESRWTWRHLVVRGETGGGYTVEYRDGVFGQGERALMFLVDAQGGLVVDNGIDERLLDSVLADIIGIATNLSEGKL